jgi:hypothetical protein
MRAITGFLLSPYSYGKARHNPYGPEFDGVKSKRATKEPGTRIYCIATAMKANTHEIPIISFARRLTHAGPVSVISVPLASSVIYVVTQWQERTPARCSLWL